MANKIVQLEDKNNDDIFPIAGGMKDDSITTAMIKNGAVTAAKLNPTIFESSSSNSTIFSAGTYLVIASINYRPISASSYGAADLELQLNNATISGTQLKLQIPAIDYYENEATWATTVIVDTVPSTISIKATSGTNFMTEHNKILAIRVG